MPRSRCCFLATLSVCLMTLTLPAFARVKLTTLPVRERVEVQLDHDDATLVEEERIVPLVRGINQVDFSWANTRIDASTIVFRVIEAVDDGDPAPEVNVLSVTYPPGENALVWQVSSARSASVVVRISYLLGGLSKDYNYRAIASADEKTLTLSQYIRVKNFAGEGYEDTQIYAGLGNGFMKPLGVNQTKQMLVQRIAGLPVNKTYTADLHTFGWLDQSQNKLRVPMHYRIKNTQEAGLGNAALPAGKVRIFQETSAGNAGNEDDNTENSGSGGATSGGGGGAAFLGEDFADHTPVGRHADLFLGVAQDIVVKRTVDRLDNRHVAGNLNHKTVTLKYEIENFKDQPVMLNLAEQIEPLRSEVGFASGQPAEWVLGTDTTLDSDPVADATDQSQVTFTVDLPARKGDEADKVTVMLQIVFRNQW